MSITAKIRKISIFHIPHSAKELLDKASEYQFDAIAITNHIEVLYTKALRKYAEKLDIV